MNTTDKSQEKVNLWFGGRMWVLTREEAEIKLKMLPDSAYIRERGENPHGDDGQGGCICGWRPMSKHSAKMTAMLLSSHMETPVEPPPGDEA